MFWFFLILALLALAAAWPFLAQRRLPPPDPRQAPGLFAALSQGETHYRWHGPARGPVAVLVHGLTTPSPVWDDVAQGIVALGYRVLTYDLYGRGYSDAAPGLQDRAFFLRQLSDLLAHENLSENITLVGYSMGGAIATAQAATHPEQIKRLVLIAPAGILPLPDTGIEGVVRRTPGLGDWLHLALGARRMQARIRANATRDGTAPALTALQLAELNRRGFLPAVLSSLRGILSQTQEEDHRALGRADVPVFAIWGEGDTVIAIRGLGLLATWNRATRQESLPDAGHGLIHTHAPQILDLLRAMLRED